MEEKRRTHYFKFIKSLGKYKSKVIDSLEQDGYCAEVHIILPPYGGTYIGTHKILLYTNGELEDFSINGWTFSCMRWRQGSDATTSSSVTNSGIWHVTRKEGSCSSTTSR